MYCSLIKRTETRQHLVLEKLTYKEMKQSVKQTTNLVLEQMGDIKLNEVIQ
jgi:hypothetical protein